jgi:hypothetical protein
LRPDERGRDNVIQLRSIKDDGAQDSFLRVPPPESATGWNEAGSLRVAFRQKRMQPRLTIPWRLHDIQTEGG